ncbi:UNVERIFIED_CONTAM: cytochrome and DOMON domain-containing protein [Sesamum calycinum]|uniref:Cytochrome and DOMON domain-containing protein n=1 Tax=Sesamum calycinum TaxID=2727403 RepID=A0AAW2Q6N3_9LAMI
MFRPVLIISVLFSLSITSHAQSCAKYNFASNQIFSSCNDLPYLNSFLHWNYDQSAKTVKIAYRHTGVSSSRWVAWAINPSGQGMVGAQALVAFQKSDGTMRAYTAPIAGYQTQLQEGDLSFPVSDLSATYARNEIVIFATLKLDGLNSTVNQVWQEGPLSGDSPAMHPTSGPNVQSMGTVNLLSGETGAAAGAGNSRTKKKNIHGVLNAVSWGILLPIGAVFARLGNRSPSRKPVSRRSILVPQGNWHYHLLSRNPPEEKWKRAYVGILIALAFIAATLEVYTWYVVVKRKKSSRPHKMPNGVNGTNGHNGYGARAQDRV